MIFMKILKNTILNKDLKKSVIFDDMNADMVSNKKLQQIVRKLSIKGRKLKISLVFIAQSYFAVSKTLDWVLHTIYYFIMRTLNKQWLQEIAINHLSDINFKDLASLYKKCTVKP